MPINHTTLIIWPLTKEIEILLMFLIFAFHVIRIHNSTLAAAAALILIIVLLWVACPWGWVTLFFYLLVATHCDTLNEKELDSHHDYLAQELYKYHLKPHLKTL